MKSQSNIEMLYYLGNKDCILQKTTGEQTTKGLEPIRQTAHGELVNMARFELILREPDKRRTCFYTFWLAIKRG